jgi:hypothetical protein
MAKEPASALWAYSSMLNCFKYGPNRQFDRATMAPMGSPLRVRDGALHVIRQLGREDPCYAGLFDAKATPGIAGSYAWHQVMNMIRCHGDVVEHVWLYWLCSCLASRRL